MRRYSSENSFLFSTIISQYVEGTFDLMQQTVVHRFKRLVFTDGTAM